MRALVTALLVLGLVGCKDDKKPAPTAAPSATTKATASTAAPTPAAKPKALDVEALKQALKCGGGGHGPCRVLDEMNDCAPWPANSAEARWLGEGHEVSKGAFLDQFTIMRSRRVATSDVGPGQLPFKIGVTSIPDDRAAEKRHADKALSAFKRGDVAKPNNQAVRYVKERGEWPESFSMEAEQNQVYVAVAGGAYLCARKDQRVVVVQRSGSRTHPADGIYAILWPVTW